MAVGLEKRLAAMNPMDESLSRGDGRCGERSVAEKCGEGFIRAINELMETPNSIEETERRL